MSEINAHDVSPVIAAHVLHYFGAGGYEPGSFVAQLISLAARADFEQRLILAKSYPGYVTAVTWAKEVRGGIDRLTKIMGPLRGDPVTADTARAGQVVQTPDGLRWWVTNYENDGDVAVALVNAVGDAHPIDEIIADFGPLTLVFGDRP